MYEENEQEYQDLKKEILGDDTDEGEEEEYTSDEGEEGIDLAEEDTNEIEVQGEQIEEDPEKKLAIKDMTETNLLNFKKTIYLILHFFLVYRQRLL